MDAIHIMLGQNGRPSRSETVPQKAAGDLGDAFSRALAALEGLAPKQTEGDPAVPPEEGTSAPDERAVEGEATLDGKDIQGEVPAEGVHVEDAKDVTADVAEPIEEESLPLAPGVVAAPAVPAESSDEPRAPVAHAEPRSRLTASHPFALTGAPPQGARIQQEQQLQQQAVAAAPTALADEAPTIPTLPAAAPVPSSGPVPSTPQGAALVLPRVTASQLFVATKGDPASDPDAVHPAGAFEEELRVAPKAAGTDRPILQSQPEFAAKVTATAPIEAKSDEGTLRLADGLSLVQSDSSLSQSRSVASALPTPATEARPVLNSIAEATVKAQNGTVELRLSPEELGRVRISMSHHDHGISVVLNVDRDDTLALLRRHASELAAALREAGLGEATIEFANRDQRPPPEPQRKASDQAFGMLSDVGIEPDRPTLRAPGNGALDIRM